MLKAIRKTRLKLALLLKYRPHNRCQTDYLNACKTKTLGKNGGVHALACYRCGSKTIDATEGVIFYTYGATLGNLAP